jgi:hypothetical protein
VQVLGEVRGGALAEKDAHVESPVISLFIIGAAAPGGTALEPAL